MESEDNVDGDEKGSEGTESGNSFSPSHISWIALATIAARPGTYLAIAPLKSTVAVEVVLVPASDATKLVTSPKIVPMEVSEMF